MRVKDAETGETAWVDTADIRVRNSYIRWWKERNQGRRRLFRRSGVDQIDIRIDQSFVHPSGFLLPGQGETMVNLRRIHRLLLIMALALLPLPALGAGVFCQLPAKATGYAGHRSRGSFKHLHW